MKTSFEKRKPRRLLAASLVAAIGASGYIAANTEPLGAKPTNNQAQSIFTNLYMGMNPSKPSELAINCYGPLKKVKAIPGSTLLTLATEYGTALSGIKQLKDPMTAVLANDYGNALADINGIQAEYTSSSDPVYVIHPNHYYFLPAKCNLSQVPER